MTSVLIQDVSLLLKTQNKRLSAAESLTGGMFINQLISINGASTITPGGIVCYDTNIKTDVLGVSNETVEKHGVVSKKCASEMAYQSCLIFNTEIGISFTGVAGPDPLEGHSVGTVYIGLYDRSIDKSINQYYTFGGDRESIRKQATEAGYLFLLEYLKM